MDHHHQFQDSPKKKKKKPPKKSRFLRCCFGFSGHRRDNINPIASAAASSTGKKRRRWFFSLSLCQKQNSAAKTVPLVDATAAAPPDDEKVNRPISKEINVVMKSSTSDTNKKTSSKSRHHFLPAASTAGGKYEKSKGLDHLINNLPPAVEYSTNQKKLSKKVSSLASAGEKTVLSHTTSAGKSPKKKKSEYDTKPSNGSTRDEQDFTYGMSILSVILIIMLFWGKLCAILCMATWFYFAPRINKRNQEPESTAPLNSRPVSSDIIHFSSEESKKKVVFDGFLDRNRSSYPTTVL